MRIYPIIAATSIASLALAPGCSAPEPPVLSGGIRDSVGVMIVENSMAHLARLEVTEVPAPAIRIGTVDGPANYQFFKARGVASLSDGTIAVLNAGEHELRFYDQTGHFIRTVGRQGNGPGEFQFPVGLRRSGDTLSVVDMVANRLTEIAPDGQVLRTRTVAARLSGFIAFLDSSTFIAAEPHSLRGLGEGVYDLPHILRRVDLRHGTVDTIGLFGGRRELQTFAGDLVVQTAVPFTVYPQVRIWNNEIYVLEGNTPNVDVYDRSGALTRSIRVQKKSRAVTSSDFAHFVIDRINELAALPHTSELAVRRADLKSIYDRMPSPPHFAYFDDLIVADSGDLWVRDYDPFPGAFQTWTRFDPAGFAVQVVRLPHAVRLYEIKYGSALGVRTDSLGIEYVERYHWSS